MKVELTRKTVEVVAKLGRQFGIDTMAYIERGVQEHTLGMIDSSRVQAFAAKLEKESVKGGKKWEKMWFSVDNMATILRERKAKTITIEKYKETDGYHLRYSGEGISINTTYTEKDKYGDELLPIPKNYVEWITRSKYYTEKEGARIEVLETDYRDAMGILRQLDESYYCMTTIDKGLRLEIRGEKKSDTSAHYDLLCEKSGQPATAFYPFILKFPATGAKTLVIEFQTDFPMRISWKINGLMFAYILAPRIEGWGD